MDEFADYNAMPRYVVSTTLQEADPRWPATILRSVDDVAALKETDKERTRLRLVEHDTYGNGIQMQVFDVVR